MRASKRVVSYGAGVDSTAMTLLLLEKKEKIDLVVFADTGGEYPETYDFLDRFDRYLREQAGRGITRIQSKQGPMYEYMIARKWTPSRRFPSHIERWKIRPIFNFLREWRKGEDVEMCIGIDNDEADRMATPRRKYVTNRYPLVDAKIGRRGAEQMIKEAGIPVPMKSGCFFCPYQRKARWLWARKEHPELFTKARKLEEEGNFFPKKTLFYGGPLAKIDDLIGGQETLDMACKAYGVCGV